MKTMPNGTVMFTAADLAKILGYRIVSIGCYGVFCDGKLTEVNPHV